MLNLIYTYKNKVRRKLDAKIVPRLSPLKCDHILKTIQHPDYLHTFCGYYDRSPISPDGTHILVTCTNADKLSDPGHDLHVFICDLETGVFTLVATTQTWNFQQGAQQQWTADGRVLLNSATDGMPQTHIYAVNPKVKKVAEIAGSSGMLCRATNQVVQYSYGPMTAYEHDYGYSYFKPYGTYETDYAASSDHLRLDIIDLNTLKVVRSFSPDQLNAIDANDAGSRAGVRYIQHVKFNPSGTDIMFVLRSYKSDRPVPYSSLYAANLSTHEIVPLIPTSDWNKGCNHPVWGNDNEVLVNLVDTDYHARKFQMIQSKTGRRRILARPHDGVGHPTLCENGAYILTDEYMPDRSQIVTRYDLPFGKRTIVGRFPKAKYPKGANRCDLHPRYDPTIRSAAIDYFQGEGRGVALVNTNAG